LNVLIARRGFEPLFFVAIRLREGKLVRWEVYGSKHGALEAVGLSE
jgi:hypothetical protein